MSNETDRTADKKPDGTAAEEKPAIELQAGVEQEIVDFELNASAPVPYPQLPTRRRRKPVVKYY